MKIKEEASEPTSAKNEKKKKSKATRSASSRFSTKERPDHERVGRVDEEWPEATDRRGE